MFRLTNEAWELKLLDIADELQRQTFGELYEFNEVRSEPVRVAAIVVGALADAFREGDLETLAKLALPARAYLKTKTGQLNEPPGVRLVVERSQTLSEAKQACMARLARLRTTWTNNADPPKQEIEEIATLLLQMLLDDASALRTLRERSPKATRGSEAAVLPGGVPSIEQRSMLVAKVRDTLERELLGDKSDEEVAKAAIREVLRGSGMNPKDAFSFAR